MQCFAEALWCGASKINSQITEYGDGSVSYFITKNEEDLRISMVQFLSISSLVREYTMSPRCLHFKVLSQSKGNLNLKISSRSPKSPKNLGDTNPF